MITLTYDNQFRKIFEDYVLGPQKINPVIQIAKSECKNIKGFDSSYLDYLIFQFRKVEKELNSLNLLEKGK